MAITFNKREATDLIRRLSTQEGSERASRSWIKKVQDLSDLCDQGSSKTHIAFLGTVLLAKALNTKVDLKAIKPKWSKQNPNSFSARSLAHGVLVPAAAEFGFHLGVTGREPLNNQPYFRMTALDDGTPVHGGARKAFDYLLQLVDEASTLNTADAEAAMAAFIVVRKSYVRSHSLASTEGLSPSALLKIVEQFVGERSDGGKRAQAVAAGMMDVYAGPSRVEAGRINDPSRKYPGDVCVFDLEGDPFVEKAIEVRDKPVSDSDVITFFRKCAEFNAREAAVLMVSPKQKPLSEHLSEEAQKLGVGLTLFMGWSEFVNQALFWGPTAKLDAASQAADLIFDRLGHVDKLLTQRRAATI